jgi:hypothetical protein
MNFKRKRRHSKTKCNICAGQRRRFGEREIIKKKDKALKRTQDL